MNEDKIRLYNIMDQHLMNKTHIDRAKQMFTIIRFLIPRQSRSNIMYLIVQITCAHALRSTINDRSDAFKRILFVIEEIVPMILNNKQPLRNVI